MDSTPRARRYITFQKTTMVSCSICPLGNLDSLGYMRRSSFALLATDAYASAGRWKEVLTVRDLMKEKGLKKIPGCSWIQIGGEFHSFVAGNTSHPKTEELYATLALLGMEMHVKAEFICG